MHAEAGEPKLTGDERAMDFFNLYDRDSNGLMSYEEYMSGTKGMSTSRVMAYSTYFSQADITGDGSLSFEEFVFAGFIAEEDTLERKYRNLAEIMPPHFCQDIDHLFLRLRSESKDGKIGRDQVIRGVRRLLLIADDEAVDPGFISALNDLYDKANVLKDDALNLNELDYFHFILRDMLVRGAVEEAGFDMDSSDEDIKNAVIDVFFKEFDLNGDGFLDLDEFVWGLDNVYSARDGQLGEKYIEETKAHFAAADADGSGSLTKEEAKDLLKRITQWAKRDE